MPVLGRAIANHLSRLDGLYSVELPEELADEIVQLVVVANQVSPCRALFVSSGSASASLAGMTTTWREILAWRNTDDRVFVWERGLHEPDTSFQSVVRPFISSRFPGTGGGECASELFVFIGLKEVWTEHGWLPAGDAFTAFFETAEWVFDVLVRMFEESGSTPGMHWSDRLLVHWSRMLDDLNHAMTTYGSNVVPRHAWEIVRLAGLPLPSAIVDGNPFLEKPQILPEKDRGPLASLWADIVKSFVLRDGGVAELLSVLDRHGGGPSRTCAWRSLNWSAIQGFPLDTPAPVVGALVLGSPPSPSLISPTIPNPMVTTVPSWWGVSTNALYHARQRLRESTPLLPDPAQGILLQPFGATSTTFVLNTRQGIVSHIHTPAKWRARVSLTNIHLRFKEDWNALHITGLVPTTAADGDAWIRPETVAISMKGATVDNVNVVATTGDQVSLTFSVTVEYSGSRDRQTGSVVGSWSPERSLVVKIDVCSRFSGQWERARKVETELELIVPSPYSPTVLIAENAKLIAVGPDAQDKFAIDAATSVTWECETTPTVSLDQEGRFDVVVYDGSLLHTAASFRPVADPWISDVQLSTHQGGLFPQSSHDLDDGVIASDHNSGNDVAVFRVKERSANLSSGLLSAVRGQPAGRKPPATSARSSILGQFQDSITRAISSISTTGLDSLYQHVVAASEEPITWDDHPGTRSPAILFSRPQGFILPGIHDGPSDVLAAHPAWGAFMATQAEVCRTLGLVPSNANSWLSGLDVDLLPAQLVRSLLIAHAALMDAAVSPADRFWASFPFSIVVVDGRQGANFGELRAVFLSPLHPVRLAWAFAVTKIARNSDADPALLGLLEGWNFPCAGAGVNPAGQVWQLIAVPIDPGAEQDFVAWSALSVLGPSGIAELPLFGGGQPLPWGGRTGINARVVERAIRDYLVVHPHINALEVDVRSVGPAPRSKEIDDALLRNLGAAEMDGVSGLGGGARVWDSLDRHGAPPTRDMLFAARPTNDSNRSFEWRAYAATNPPQDADLALVENATVHLAVVSGSAHGVLGTLPLKRFSPSELQGTQFDQVFLPRDGEDLLGLSGLLARIEGNLAGQLLALRAMPQAHALGIGLGAQWEVLGAFNIDPTLLSTLVTSTGTTGQRRLLWEWRPSWMPTDRKASDLARRPYYVVARIPASLSMALHSRQAISTANANQLLHVLGQRGIGLSVLNAEGGTQESAAAGYFYAIQLLSPIAGHDAFQRLQSGERPSAFGVIPLDPVEPILQGLVGRRLQQRADLLAVAISWNHDGSLRICIVPGEIKHHGMPMRPEDLPTPTTPELRHARGQLTETVELLQEIIRGLTSSTGIDGCAGHCIKRLGIATLFDLAMSFSSSPPSAAERSRILAAALGGPMSIGIGDPLLLWFAPGAMQFTGSPHVIDPHQPHPVGDLQVREIYVDPSALPGLWWDGTTNGPAEASAKSVIDQTILTAFSQCARTSVAIPSERDSLATLLRIDTTIAAPVVVNTQQPKPPTDAHSQPPATAVEAVSEPAPPPDPEPASSDPLADESEPHEESQSTAGDTAASPVEADTVPTLVAPRAAVGWTELGPRYGIMGKLTGGDDPVAIDLDHPKSVGIFGYMGSGKSYLLGTLIESALVHIPGINALPAPLAVVIFNYRRNASDRFELTSLAVPNDDQRDIERLATEYHSRPLGIPGIHVLCLPGELRPPRQLEYGPLHSSELFFDPASLDVEDWELLMGEPGSEAVFARTIRNTLGDLRLAGDITLDALDRQVNQRLTGQSRAAARLRLDFVRRYISATQGTNFADLLRPGHALVVDLRQPLFNKDDALRFFLICANQISRIQGRFNKLIVFDEAHEYLSEAFGERMESRIRLMRHEGTSYVFATQDVRSIPVGISRFLTTRFVFNLGTRENVHDLEQVAPEFRGLRLLDLKPGHCLVQGNSSVDGFFQRPREIRIRPRVTRHGGTSQIFSGSD